MKKRFTLITGGTEGLGLELCKLFAKDKHNIFIIARNKDKLEKTKSYIEERYKVEVETLSIDLSVDNSCEKVYEFVEKNNFYVDNLINNAGIGSFGSFVDMDMSHEETLININIKSLTKLTNYFLKDMVRNKDGAILNVASTAAFCAGPKMSTYYASKAYVLSLTEALHEEVKQYGIKVCCLCPGAIRTEFQSKAKIEKNEKAKGLIMEAEDVALIAYKEFIKGKTIIIPGFLNRILIIGNKIIGRKLARIMVFKANK